MIPRDSAEVDSAEVGEGFPGSVQKESKVTSEFHALNAGAGAGNKLWFIEISSFHPSNFLVTEFP
jgi:hypothetical protein